MEKTFFYIALSKKKLQCIQPGDMSFFGTVHKADGEMSLHFDEQDVIHCILYLRSILSDGQTCYYN